MTYSGLALAIFYFEPILRGENCLPVFYFQIRQWYGMGYLEKH
jgi:hypothetical protein